MRYLRTSELSGIADKSFSDLVKEVVTPGLCTVCGTCIAVCPFNALILREESFKRLELHELEITRDTRRSIEDLCEHCGFCYYNCSETTFDLEKAEKGEFGSVAKDELGHFVEAYMAQATDEGILENAQCGGVATALLRYMLESKAADAAVVVTSTEDPPWKPKPTVIVDPKDLWMAQKTKYTPAATVIGVRSALYEWVRSRVAVVATPCQVRGIWTATTSPKGYVRMLRSIELMVGLFCYGTYSYNDLFIDFLAGKHGISLSGIGRIDLDTEKLRVYVHGELELEVHRRDVGRYLRKSCRDCHDFTNRLADVSLGGVGSPEKWTTVLIRTERGKKIFDDAARRGYVKVDPLPVGALEKIKGLARLKLEEGVKI
ncbi:MAG: Coenzyme F420 hydrogenase/dehydrogenase, beta subunit C-terminal domain [Candidatus Bathyarchaeota archaeon]|nr:Coenzyme F420 hydrogenase/dehydrogenase, beta subunit C-terminal domain [Candidatus Bathyarchaeota archaeon]